MRIPLSKLAGLLFAISAALAVCEIAAAQTQPAQPPAQMQPVAGTPILPRSTPAVMHGDPGYKIHAGDQLNVQVYGEQTLSQPVTVLQDGSIQYPLVGRLQVAGSTPAEASEKLRSSLMKYLKHPMVTVGVNQEGASSVLVLGNVKTPGKYVVRSGARVSDALAAAGGLGPTDGALPDARVTQPDGTMQNVSLNRLLVKGDDSQNVAMTNNAILYVSGPLMIHVQVLGAVDRPGYIDISEGDRLSVAIARAGAGANSRADLNHVYITRKDPSGGPQSHEINMYEALKGGDLRYDPVLAKGDVVFVPEARKPMQFSPLSLLTRLFGLPL